MNASGVIPATDPHTDAGFLHVYTQLGPAETNMQSAKNGTDNQTHPNGRVYMHAGSQVPQHERTRCSPKWYMDWYRAWFMGCAT